MPVQKLVEKCFSFNIPFYQLKRRKNCPLINECERWEWMWPDSFPVLALTIFSPSHNQTLYLGYFEDFFVLNYNFFFIKHNIKDVFSPNSSFSTKPMTISQAFVYLEWIKCIFNTYNSGFSLIALCSELLATNQSINNELTSKYKVWLILIPARLPLFGSFPLYSRNILEKTMWCDVIKDAN